MARARDVTPEMARVEEVEIDLDKIIGKGWFQEHQEWKTLFQNIYKDSLD